MDRAAVSLCVSLLSILAHVLRLDVAVCDALGVEEAEGQDNPDQHLGRLVLGERHLAMVTSHQQQPRVKDSQGQPRAAKGQLKRAVLPGISEDGGGGGGEDVDEFADGGLEAGWRQREAALYQEGHLEVQGFMARWQRKWCVLDAGSLKMYKDYDHCVKETRANAAAGGDGGGGGGGRQRSKSGVFSKQSRVTKEMPLGDEILDEAGPRVSHRGKAGSSSRGRGSLPAGCRSPQRVQFHCSPMSATLASLCPPRAPYRPSAASVFQGDPLAGLHCIMPNLSGLTCPHRGDTLCIGTV
eukprot:SAG22_NODE_4395_length_1283_cov_1.357264_1_plen_297_part_00